jgi:predicted kinase
MRGVPGGGKTYRARQLTTNDLIFSADKWFSRTEDPEEYRKNWAKEKLFTAHNWCKSMLSQAMQKGLGPVVVDNTNIKRRDFMPYIDMAKQYQYMYVIEESQSPWWLTIKELLTDIKANAKELDRWVEKLTNGFDYNGITIKNQHGVPEEAIRKMLFGFQPYHGGEYVEQSGPNPS